MKQVKSQRQLIQMLINRQKINLAKPVVAELNESDIDFLKEKQTVLVRWFKNFCAVALVFTIIFFTALTVIRGYADEVDRDQAMSVKHQFNAEGAYRHE